MLPVLLVASITPINTAPSLNYLAGILISHLPARIKLSKFMLPIEQHGHMHGLNSGSCLDVDEEEEEGKVDVGGEGDDAGWS